MIRSAILQPGANCWRIAQARRATVLVGADKYFKVLRNTLARAERSIFILGWDVDNRLQMPGDSPADDLPEALGDLLDVLTARRSSLHVFILIWDFASLYADAREWLPIFRSNWKAHGRLHFHMDGRHPPGATQHQKLVVVDDDVAFCGGMDLRRAPQDGNSERHEVQAMLQGAPAQVLGELARARWQWATGRDLRPEQASTAAPDAWPDGVAADFERVATGIARTEPAYAAREAAHEIERLYLDAIAAAQDAIYIENHYLTAPGVADALAVRLGETDGPAIVIILPRATRGWLAENEIGIRQTHLVRRLRAADRYHRLRICCPHGSGPEGAPADVRGKVLIVDEQLLSIGSANLSQRSMRLDSELNIALEARSREESAGIRHVRARLLGGYLGPSAVPEAPGEPAGARLLRMIDAQAGHEPGLRTLDVSEGPPAGGALPSGMERRPEHPISPERMSDFLVPAGPRAWAGFGYTALALLLLLAALAAAWHWTPLAEWLNVENLAAQVSAYGDHPLTLPLVVAAYVVGGLVVAPITVLVVVTVLAFGVGKGIVYALLGSLASASAVYGIGHAMGRDSIRRLAGARLNRVSRALARRGVLAMILVRWLPLAPFSIVNLVAGASHIRFGHYLIGSAIGIFVDIVFIAVFMSQLQAALREPGWASIGIIVALIVLAAGSALALRAWLRKQRL